MKEYIAREAAKWHLYKEFIEDKQTACKVFRALKSIPSADVVEVVRCEKCINWDTSWIPRCGSGHYCPMIDLVTDADFFCKDGKRKGGGK